MYIISEITLVHRPYFGLTCFEVIHVISLLTIYPTGHCGYVDNLEKSAITVVISTTTSQVSTSSIKTLINLK